jgi:acetyl-CoA C-acetyltransferase
MDVAIVGVGLHPFGRFAGVSGIEMGAVAIRRALADAGVEWRDVQFAFGGSYEVDNPDAVVALMGLTGIPFPPLRFRVLRTPDPTYSGPAC